MWLTSWLRNRLSNSKRSRRDLRRFRRSMMEVLEPRWAPAVFSVAKFNDVDPHAGKAYVGTLRWAVEEAAKSPGADTIILGTPLPDPKGAVASYQLRNTIRIDNQVLTIQGGSPHFGRSSISSLSGDLAFEVTSGTVEFVGVTIKNPGKPVEVLTSKFPTSGVAIWNHSGAFLYLTDSNITDNRNNGIINEGFLTARESSFTMNGSNGIVNSGGFISLDHCAISGNRLVGIWSEGNGSVKNCLVSRNLTGIRNYGNLYVGESRIINNNYDDNLALPGYGSGIVNIGAITVERTFINGNKATNGGGIWNSGVVTLDHTEMHFNFAWNGAGIWNSEGTLNIIDSRINENLASLAGVLYSTGGEASLERSDIKDNIGAGIWSKGASLDLVDCSISGNAGSDQAGGVHAVGDAEISITTTEIKGNFGGGIATVPGDTPINSGSLEVKDSFIIGNSSNSDGAGILNLSLATVKVENTTISGNKALNGGGIKNATGSLYVFGCDVSANAAGIAGGGIYTAGEARIERSTIKDNSGGGIVNNKRSSLGVIECVIAGNASTGDGAGILNFGTLTVLNTMIMDNKAINGAGIKHDSGSLNVTGSTISGNTASNRGGGIYSADHAALNFTSSTISGNTARDTGGGLYVAGPRPTFLTSSTITGNRASRGGGLRIFDPGDGTNARLIAHNSIVAVNTAAEGPDLFGILDSHGHNLFGHDQPGLLFDPTDHVGVDPLLSPLQDHGGPTKTHALLPGSPAINAGDDFGTPATDQRGLPRMQQDHVDIGAFESRGFVASVSGAAQETLVNTRFALPLALTLSSPFGEPVAGGKITFHAPHVGPSAALPGADQTVDLDSDGNASITAIANGTPGRYVVTASTTGLTETARYELTNLNVAVSLDPLELPSGTAGVSYNASFSASGAPGPFTFAVTEGSLPPDMLLSADGLLSGTCTLAETFSFQVTASNAVGDSGSWYYTLTVNPAALAALLLSAHLGPVPYLFNNILQVTLVDAFGNDCTNYRGTVHFFAPFHPSGGEAYLPDDYAFTEEDHGTHEFSFDVSTSGLWTFVVYDISDPLLRDSVELFVP